MEIKLSDWIKSINKELESDAMPIVIRGLRSIKEQTIKLVEKRGYAFDMTGDKIVKD